VSDLATTIHNERTKLTATWLNGVAIALMAVGGFAPTISYLAATVSAPSPEWLTTTSAACFGFSVALHFMARKVLGRLRS
jgi:hypothetical protein